jgi:membrane protease subunit (stomatin/prohibitin family)
MIQELQRKAVYRNAGMAAASLADAQAEAMKSAAANQAVGPMFAFTNMNAAMNAGGMNMNQLYEMDAANKKAASPSENTGAKQTNAWQCSCGMQNTGKFCMDCGSKKPESKSWTCTCGTQNTGKFCEECGQPKPASTTWTCACGMVNQGKFCAQCGNPRT